MTWVLLVWLCTASGCVEHPHKVGTFDVEEDCTEIESLMLAAHGTPDSAEDGTPWIKARCEMETRS